MKELPTPMCLVPEADQYTTIPKVGFNGIKEA